MSTQPTDLPAGARRTVRVVGIPLPRPSSVPAVFRTAARLLAVNGLYQGDFVEDPFDRETATPHAARPMSIVAALRCAASGSPHSENHLSEAAIATLAHRLEVDGHGPLEQTQPWFAFHVDNWGDQAGRTTESAVVVLEAAGDASEVAA